MYLKSLELHGFKSFPNRTVLSFERGATVIVGPNGSGKSNISDAMRWVLGELSSRNIRGTKMEDVIFGGTDDRRPMGFAEVTVVFDNSEPNRLDSPFDEVSVTRRYYRTGDSEYLINREPKRLRDIYELFMNTGVGREGYSIIGQGKIAEIVSKKSDERRTIFEEAAGISKFRHRKEDAEKKLAATQDNLDRVNDILTELSNRVGPLEKEAEKAKKCMAIYEEKKRADVSLWLYDTTKIRDDVKEAENALKLAQHEYEIIEASLNDLTIQQENLYQKKSANNLLSESLLREIAATTDKIYQLENAMNIAETEFAHSNERVAECELRLSELNRKQDELVKERKNYEDKIVELEKKHKELMDKRLECLAEQSELMNKMSAATKERENAMADLMGEENHSTDLRVRIDVLKNSKIADGTKSQDMEAEIANYEKEGEALQKEVDRCEANAADFKTKIADKDEILEKFKSTETSFAEKKASILDEINRDTVERDTLLQKADTLQRMSEHFEGYSESIKFVMREYAAGNIQAEGKVYGPVSSLINVDKEYIIAIETALGGSLQNIVVDNETNAKACMMALKHASAGRATFYPISAIRPVKETDEIRSASKMPGFVGRADTLVKSEAKFRTIVEFLLLRTCIFDNIDNASAAAKKLGYAVKMVTLDGQVINAGGSFTGGSQKRESGILTRLSEISTLKAKADALSKNVDKNNDELNKMTATFRDEQQKAQDAEQEKNLLLSLSRTQFAELDEANAKLVVNRNTVEKLRYDYNNLLGHTSLAEEEIRSLTADFDAAAERISALHAFIDKKAEEIGVSDERVDELTALAADYMLHATETSKDIETAEQMEQSYDERIDGYETEKQEQIDRIADLRHNRSTISDRRVENKEARTALEAQLEALNQKRCEVQNGSDEYEKELNQLRTQEKEKTNSRQVISENLIRTENRCVNLHEKQDKLGSQLWDDYEITYEEAVALDYPKVTEENRSEVAEASAAARRKLHSYGSFNPDSIEEYAEVKARFDALNTQYTDLTNSSEEMKTIIADMETEMKESFSHAFYEINRHFGETFRELFGGGSAELSLTDPEDILTTGIEIKAAPPGKIIKSMSLLSGGEQSFVAIALLFAILKVNPTPFCILDEIEAALDEVNVYRFGEYIKKFGDGTQFILITHRRGTMEIGDRLYGVTMPHRGISQAIEVDVSEIEGKQKELLDGVL